ncbi:MAG: nucleoside-diphosphate kinase [Actinomycetota bacterium]
MERTLVIIKPDGVRKRLIGEIISRFENRGLKIAELKLVRFSVEAARRLYDIHEGKDFFDDLVNFVTSGVVVAMILEGESAVSVVRSMIGATNPLEAQPGTIRGDFALSIGENIVHAADSPERAQKEIVLLFEE